MLDHRVQREGGSTIVELLVAAGVSLLALGMVMDSAIPAMRALEVNAQRDDRRIELETAGDIVARTIRAARPEALRAAIVGDDRTLILALGAGRTARLQLEAGDLTLAVEGDPTRRLRLPEGLLVGGLDMERSSFALVDAPEDSSPVTGPPGAIVITLTDDDITVVRVTAMRLRTHLDGATPW